MANVPGLYKVTQAGVVSQLSIPLALYCGEPDATIANLPVNPGAFLGDGYRPAWSSGASWWNFVSPPVELQGLTDIASPFRTSLGYRTQFGSASYKVQIGYYAGYGVSYSSPYGSYGVNVGYYAGYGASGTYNVIIGYSSGNSPACSGNWNILIGANANFNASSVSTAIAIGNGAITKGSNTILIGTTGQTDAWLRGNTQHFGNESAVDKFWYFQNSASGVQPGFKWDNTLGEVQWSNDGSVWTAMGGGGGGLVGFTNDTYPTNTPGALTALGIGAANSVSGTYSPNNEYLTCVGYRAGYTLSTTGSWGTFVGARAGNSQTGNYNTAVGAWAGYNGNGTYNTALGIYAMYGSSSGDTKSYCTAVGYHAGWAHTIGNDCTYVGSNAGSANYNAVNNTFVGSNAGLACTASDCTLIGYNTAPAVTTGLSNTCVGSNAGQLLGTTASYNTLIGHQAFARGTSRNNVTAIGYRAGYNYDVSSGIFIGAYTGGGGSIAAIVAGSPIFIGQYAGSYGPYGVQNIAIGTEALLGNSTTPGAGRENICVGYRSGRRMEGGSYNTLIGGNAGEDIVEGTRNCCLGHFAGNNILSGTNNIAIGASSCTFISTTSYNIGIGTNTLYSNFFAPEHAIAIGDSAGYTSGDYCISIGDSTAGAQSSTPGPYNIAIGHQALYGNGNSAAGGYNIALGFHSLWSLGTTSNNNIAIGNECRKWSRGGAFNITLGYQACWDTSSVLFEGHITIGYKAGYKDQADGYEIAIGYEALGSTGTAHTGTGQNVCVGYRTLFACTTGYANTILGYGCGTTISTGYNNVILGHLCEGVAGSGSHDNVLIGSSCTSALDHTVAIGEGIALTVANTGQISPTAPAGPPTTTGYFWIGDGTTTYTLQAQTITALSDERIKKNIEELPFGLDFINGLHPRLFDWKTPSTPSSGRKTMGFIAQEMKKDSNDMGLKGSVYLDDNDKNWGVDYNQLVAPLVKAVQELSAQVVDLKKELAELKAQR